jgi:hypothetical protein
LLAQQLVAAAIQLHWQASIPQMVQAKHNFKSTGFRKMLPVVLHIQKIQLIGTSDSKEILYHIDMQKKKCSKGFRITEHKGRVLEIVNNLIPSR